MAEPAGPTLARLVREGVLDAELAGLLSLLVEARTPVVVASPDRVSADRLLAALAVELPGGTRQVAVRPDDEFEWLREAVELGWRRERAGAQRPAEPVIASSDGVLVAHGLGAPDGVTGDRARIVVRSLALGYGLLATVDGAGLDDVLAALAAPSVGTDDDERSRLGVVVVLATTGSGDDEPPGMVAAHYVRPVALDPHGHVQRLPPAVLATWNPSRTGWDHFAWGMLAELGDRMGRTPLEVEREQARRASAITREAAGRNV